MPATALKTYKKPKVKHIGKTTKRGSIQTPGGSRIPGAGSKTTGKKSKATHAAMRSLKEKAKAKKAKSSTPAVKSRGGMATTPKPPATASAAKGSSVVGGKPPVTRNSSQAAKAPGAKTEKYMGTAQRVYDGTLPPKQYRDSMKAHEGKRSGFMRAMGRGGAIAAVPLAVVNAPSSGSKNSSGTMYGKQASMASGGSKRTTPAARRQPSVVKAPAASKPAAKAASLNVAKKHAPSTNLPKLDLISPKMSPVSKPGPAIEQDPWANFKNMVGDRMASRPKKKQPTRMSGFSRK